jgi:hypothetical protein
LALKAFADRPDGSHYRCFGRPQKDAVNSRRPSIPLPISELCGEPPTIGRYQISLMTFRFAALSP